ncbi:methyltransferase [Kitasatospora sp. GP82]|uniref:class I SAM-dependent methyltransferase n=1 Tax=Kitasatospora sp. GP82 TaxID=3035089 RepID=UPI0024733BC9|nr:methyltransferase [Kitasatospora sp. GP82]MDH6124183.1 2-polyprenyl-3-methyl-5-hydroxy-6-metoxy-1,4-benzoquinol methylase [Kitasatospora sp. GP82]
MSEVREPQQPGSPKGGATADAAYTERLVTLEQSGFRRLLPAQAPYRWNLRRLGLGRVLDVGCGVGRNLQHCAVGSVGVDHNETSVATARARGLEAYTAAEFEADPQLSGPGAFDGMLVAHVLEHLDAATGEQLLKSYLPSVRPGGRVVLITPQPAGYRSDPTHVRFVDFDGLRAHAEQARLTVERRYSFPFPQFAGRFFKYNEYVLVALVP